MEINFKGTLDEFTATFRIPLAEWHVEVIALLNALKEKVEKIMADFTLQEAAIDKLNETTNTIADAVDQSLVRGAAEKQVLVDKLKVAEDKVAAGEVVEAADVAAISAAAARIGGANTTLEAVRDHLRTVGTDPVTPLPDPVIPAVDPVV